jgi:hypothetical protein
VILFWRCDIGDEYPRLTQERPTYSLVIDPIFKQEVSFRPILSLSLRSVTGTRIVQFTQNTTVLATQPSQGKEIEAAPLADILDLPIPEGLYRILGFVCGEDIEWRARRTKFARARSRQELSLTQ